VLGGLAQPEDRESLLVNGKFASARAASQAGPQPDDWKQGGAPAGWSFWQAGVSAGKPGWDPEMGRIGPGAGALIGVSNGCLIQRIEVEPGARYAVAAWCRVQGECNPSVTMRWQTAEGKWHAEALDVSLGTARAAGDWNVIAGAGVVPEGTGKPVVLLSVNGQQSDQDIVWWDDVAVFELK